VTGGEEPTVNVKFCLAFPREAVSVPVMRRVLGDTLRNLGVVDESIEDILLAVTEACTNVLRHGGSARRYEVVTSVGASGCLVEVLDSGQGFGPRRPGATARTENREPTRPAERARSRRQKRSPDQERAARRRAAVAAAGRACSSAPPSRRPDDQIIARLPESGRGLQIMRALVDDVTLESGVGRGTVVSMRKRVAWRQDAPLTGLSASSLRDAG